jgi:hypothetical protein
MLRWNLATVDAVTVVPQTNRGEDGGAQLPREARGEASGSGRCARIRQSLVRGKLDGDQAHVMNFAGEKSTVGEGDASATATGAGDGCGGERWWERVTEVRQK